MGNIYCPRLRSPVPGTPNRHVHGQPRLCQSGRIRSPSAMRAMTVSEKRAQRLWPVSHQRRTRRDVRHETTRQRRTPSNVMLGLDWSCSPIRRSNGRGLPTFFYKSTPPKKFTNQNRVQVAWPSCFMSHRQRDGYSENHTIPLVADL